MKDAIAILDKFAYETIAKRRENVGNDMLSLYIQTTDESDAYLRDVMMNFLIAGRDTTGQTLTWFFHILTQNPEIESKVNTFRKFVNFNF